MKDIWLNFPTQTVALGNHFRTFGTQCKKPHPSRSCRLQNTFLMNRRLGKSEMKSSLPYTTYSTKKIDAQAFSPWAKEWLIERASKGMSKRMNDRCERMSERRCKWPNSLHCDLIVILPKMQGYPAVWFKDNGTAYLCSNKFQGKILLSFFFKADHQYKNKQKIYWGKGKRSCKNENPTTYQFFISLFIPIADFCLRGKSKIGRILPFHALCIQNQTERIYNVTCVLVFMCVFVCVCIS